MYGTAHPVPAHRGDTESENVGSLFSRITLQVGKGEIRETNPSSLAEETKDSVVGELNGVVPLLLLQPSLPHSCFTD